MAPKFPGAGAPGGIAMDGDTIGGRLTVITGELGGELDIPNLPGESFIPNASIIA